VASRRLEVVWLTDVMSSGGKIYPVDGAPRVAGATAPTRIQGPDLGQEASHYRSRRVAHFFGDRSRSKAEKNCIRDSGKAF